MAALFQNSVVTNDGRSLFSSWVQGSTLNFDGAAAGTGTVDVAALIVQTALVNQKQTLSILAASPVTGGIKLKLRITSAGLSTGYVLNQFGIWAHVGSGQSKMVAIYQDATGITIPAESEMADFIYTFYAIIQMSNTGTFTLTVDPSALVSVSDMEDAIGAALATAAGDATNKAAAAENAAKAASRPVSWVPSEADLGGVVNGAAVKTTPADNDMVPLMDSAADNVIKKLSWTNIKTALTTLFGTVYATLSHAHGSITNAGAIGTTANLPVFTGGSGVMGTKTAAEAIPALGGGYGTCSTASGTTTKTATLSGFTLVTGAIVGVTFSNAHTGASMTMNINSTGAKTVQCNGAAVGRNMITAGMKAIFQYDGTYYHLLNASTASALASATLSSASWSGIGSPYEYSYSNSSITATNPIELLPGDDITIEQLEALQAANIIGGSQAAGSITLLAYGDPPTIDIPVKFIIRRDL